MKNKVLKLLSVMLVFVIFTGMLTVGTFATSAGEFELKVRFSHDEYIPGETVTARIYLTGAADEAEKYIAGFSTQISFDSSLEFVKGEFSNYFTLGNNDKAYIDKTTYNGKNIVNILLVTETPVTVDTLREGSADVDDDDEIMLAKLTFSVPDPKEGTVGLKFEEVSLDDGSLPYMTDIYNEETDEYTLTIQSAKAETSIINRKAIIRYEEAYYDSDSNPDVVFAEPDVYVSDTNGGVLLAKLYDKNTGITVAPIVVKQLTSGINSFVYDDGDTDEEYDSIKFEVNSDVNYKDLAVQYYIWDSMLTMKCLTETVTFEDIEKL